MAMCPRNPLRRTLVARALSGMRVCSNITICCLPAVLADLHVHAACLGCQYLISADCRRCPLGDSHWAVGPNLACDGHYVTHLRTSSGRYWVPEPRDLASTKTDMQPGGLARRSNTCCCDVVLPRHCCCWTPKPVT